MAEKNDTLPYRTSGEDLVRLLEARARGRTLDQIQTLNFSTGAFSGTLLAAQALGLVDSESDNLTERGTEFALARAGGETRRRVLRAGILEYDPYALLLEAIEAKGELETPVEWFETWWASHNYGSSQTNRNEASYAFGKIAEEAELGDFIAGRRGHSTRVKWKADLRTLRQDRAEHQGTTSESEKDDDGTSEGVGMPGTEREVLREKRIPRPAADDENHLLLDLSGGRKAELRVPSKLSQAEKKRLLALLDLLIVTESEDEEVPG